MTRSALLTGILLTGLVVAVATSQPPGPPRYELGRVFPPPLREQLNLTPEQEKALAEIEKDLKEKLGKLLTDEQKKIAADFRPHGPGGPDGKGGFGKDGAGKRGPGGALLDVKPDPTPGPRFVANGELKVCPAEPKNTVLYTLTGAALEGELGDLNREYSGRGIRFLSGGEDKSGSVTWTVQGLKLSERWLRFKIRALAQENFLVEKGLYLRVEFFKDGGKTALDHITKSIYAQVERERTDLRDPGTNRNLGIPTWRNYTLEVRTPFPEVDTLRVGAGFAGGAGKVTQSEFWINEVEITPIPDPVKFAPPAQPAGKTPPALKSLVKLGGRWYYDPCDGDRDPPRQFDHTNVDRLYYLSNRLETPFVGNVSAWLRKGYYDCAGKLVEKDQFVPDAVVLSFTGTHLVMKSKNLPNHPTAVFPDRSRLLDGNPNIIREQADTWYLPLEPKVNPRHSAMDARNTNRALPMGPIGVALNGVVFFNPFDADVTEAVWRLDRCCGHPSPGSQYHYHKYPVCLNTPWLDEGSGHSPLIGFAFDGFPIYGPYEAAGELAREAQKNPLNAFNLHEDDERGPHYHVTPGKFPHLIGGFWGEFESRNRQGPPR
jgi:hypothetical protein